MFFGRYLALHGIFRITKEMLVVAPPLVHPEYAKRDLVFLVEL